MNVLNNNGDVTNISGQLYPCKLPYEESGRAPICPVFAALLLLRNAEHLKLPADSPICATSQHQVLSTESMTKP
ncbi:hypothetical protein JG688_00002674 [Phytophthora aleatoria]|uniref:Uncharacterized protein n=1 Tax=Phytophthora aleatoria TaxID=2496075 RepID=A0A8J5IUZ8_9STRA|nr:hypothetical protein JG688_00002674 [Phytophthora aleatoria]